MDGAVGSGRRASSTPRAHGASGLLHLGPKLGIGVLPAVNDEGVGLSRSIESGAVPAAMPSGLIVSGR